jgi:hypothetical protein
MSDQQNLANICEQVYRRFPEVAGKQPRVFPQAEGQLLLVFHATAKTSDGRALPRTVRVVVSAAGKIVKMTTSK